MVKKDSPSLKGRRLIMTLLSAYFTALLKRLAGPRYEFRVSPLPDGSIVLRPMSASDADMWRSGLVDEIVENFAHPDRMIRVKPDKL